MTTDFGSAARSTATLPNWTSVLAVVAHPDDESFGLGAVLATFARSGTTVSVLCLTQGEASTIQGDSENLATLRAAELQEAATTLGIASAVLRDYPDGSLADIPLETLTDEVAQSVARSGAEALVVFDLSGVTGHSDHTAASAAAMEAATTLDLPVLGWTLPHAVAQQLNDEFDADFVGHDSTGIDLAISVNRDSQRVASLAHASQAIPTSVLWRRLELLGDTEHLRWLRLETPS